mmetsp:Transcript_46217/g.131844  ORF Transcript_46217/g.131844 Transcript_46217/m.131844 type:complete len:130 (+) Transcript_46217:73-462(+)
MKLASTVFAVLSAVAAGSALASTGARSGARATCGPQTKVCIASFADAASVPQYECKEAVNGAKVVITPSQTEFGAKVCGPGKFFFSPMQCAGDNFEYKKTTTEVDASSTTTSCQQVSFPYKMACYAVEC